MNIWRLHRATFGNTRCFGELSGSPAFRLRHGVPCRLVVFQALPLPPAISSCTCVHRGCCTQSSRSRKYAIALSTMACAAAASPFNEETGGAGLHDLHVAHITVHNMATANADAPWGCRRCAAKGGLRPCASHRLSDTDVLSQSGGSKCHTSFLINAAFFQLWKLHCRCALWKLHRRCAQPRPRDRQGVHNHY